MPTAMIIGASRGIGLELALSTLLIDMPGSLACFVRKETRKVNGEDISQASR